MGFNSGFKGLIKTTGKKRNLPNAGGLKYARINAGSHSLNRSRNQQRQLPQLCVNA